MKPSDVQNAVPAVQAIGVDDSLQKDGTYKEFDVTVSVNFSPKSGMNTTVASKTERMSAAKLTAFREETNLWNGEDFLKNFFKDKWKEVQAQVQTLQTVNPAQVTNNYTGEVHDGQPVQSTADSAQSSVATALQGSLSKPEVTTAPAAPRDEAYLAPAMGPEGQKGYEAPEGNVPNYPYESNDSNDYKVPDAVAAATQDGVDPQLPEQEKPADPAKGNPEQDGTATAEQPKAAEVVEAAQGGATAATTASKNSAKKSK